MKLPRELYEFPEDKTRLINWREVAPMELGNWAGLHGDMETELIVSREAMGSKQTVIGRSVFFPGAFHWYRQRASEGEFQISNKGMFHEGICSR